MLMIDTLHLVVTVHATGLHSRWEGRKQSLRQGRCFMELLLNLRLAFTWMVFLFMRRVLMEGRQDCLGKEILWMGYSMLNAIHLMSTHVITLSGGIVQWLWSIGAILTWNTYAQGIKSTKGNACSFTTKRQSTDVPCMSGGIPLICTSLALVMDWFSTPMRISWASLLCGCMSTRRSSRTTAHCRRCGTQSERAHYFCAEGATLKHMVDT